MIETASTNIIGAELSPVSDPDRYLDWLLCSDARGIWLDSENPVWARVACTDTLVWGVLRHGKWLLSSSVDVGIRTPKKTRIIEARIFSEEQDVLIWRTDANGFTGRVAREQPGADTLYTPIHEARPFEDTLVQVIDDVFQRRESPGGNIYIVPTGTHLNVVRHLERSESNGMVRVALTRWESIGS